MEAAATPTVSLLLENTKPIKAQALWLSKHPTRLHHDPARMHTAAFEQTNPQAHVTEIGLSQAGFL